MTGWRLILADGTGSSVPCGLPRPLSGPTNMAVDAALLEGVRHGAPPVLRLYRWDPPTLSFGRNQPAAGLYDAPAARKRGIGFVRRPTGGQAVLHADELTYAVIAPMATIGRPREAYRRINEALVVGLRKLGVEAELAARSGTGAGAARAEGARADGYPNPRLDWRTACFRDAAEGEVVVGGRKLVGSAQRREGRVILQHGSILVSGSQAAAEDLLKGGSPRGTRGGAAVARGWTTLESELGDPPAPAALVATAVSGFEQILGTALAPAGLSVEEATRARELLVRFASSEWTWRR